MRQLCTRRCGESGSLTRLLVGLPWTAIILHLGVMARVLQLSLGVGAVALGRSSIRVLGAVPGAGLELCVPSMPIEVVNATLQNERSVHDCRLPSAYACYPLPAPDRCEQQRVVWFLCGSVWVTFLGR